MPRRYVKKNRPKKYSVDDVSSALEAIADGISIRQAAKTFGVPYTNLYRHANAEITYKRPGRPTKFSDIEECHLVQAAIALQEWGEPMTISEFLDLSKRYAFALKKSHLFPVGAPTYEWLRQFLSRHSNLVLKRSSPLEKTRAALTEKQVDEWFELLKKVIDDNNLANSPAQLFNADETGFSDSVGSSKVIVHRGTSNAYQVQGGTGGKSFTTVMICASATGQLLPPFVVYRGKRLFHEWCLGGPSDAGFSTSESGWMQQELFYQWFEQVFLEVTKDLPRPLLLIVDGHKSHFMVETLQLAIKKNVIIVCLPPHATHILQPLDIVFFNPVKIEWKKLLKTEYGQTRNQTIGKAKFPVLLSQLWETNAVKNKTNIVKSFMKAGIFPLNATSIDRTRLLKNTTQSAITLIDYQVDCHNDPIPSIISPVTTSSIPLGIVDQSLKSTTTLPSIYSAFNSSLEAISALDAALEETSSIKDDHDDDYIPNHSISKSTTNAPPSKVRQSSSKKPMAASHLLLHSPAPRRSRRKTTIHPTLFDLESSDEENDHVPTDDSSKEQRHALQAITNTLHAVYASTPQSTRVAPTKRTMVKRSSGQLMTEQHVLEQLEQQRQKQTSKKTKKTIRTPMPNKRKKTDQNDKNGKSSTESFLQHSKSSEILYPPSSIDQNATILGSVHHTSSFAATPLVPILMDQTRPMQPHYDQPPLYQTLDSTWNTASSYFDVSSHRVDSTFSDKQWHTAHTALMPSTQCSQCRVIGCSVTQCSSCYRTLCTTCTNYGQQQSCHFCIVRSSYSL